MSDTPPLDPSSPEARQWVLDELGTGRYTTEPSWWQRFVEWLGGLLDFSPGGGPPRGLLVVALLFVLAVVVAVVVWRVRPEARVGRRRPRAAGAVDDEGLDAAAYRDRARRALGREDWDGALLDAYRAIAAAAVERTLLADLPGRTAHEVGVGLAPVFPEHARAIASATNAFDDVRYGHRPAAREQARATVDLEDTLRRSRPSFRDDPRTAQATGR